MHRIKNIRLRGRRAPVGCLAKKPVVKEGFETLAAHHRHVASSYTPRCQSDVKWKRVVHREKPSVLFFSSSFNGKTAPIVDITI